MATFASSIGFLSAVALATACAVPAVGQSFDIRTLFSPPAPSSGAAAPTGNGGTQEWSGESGASNHPLMTAQAIRVAAANFRDCLAGLWPQAQRRGVPRAVFEDNIAGLEPDLRIMDLLDAQPEFTKSFWDYLDILVNEDRIQNGRAILAKHRATFDAVVRQLVPLGREQTTADIGRTVAWLCSDKAINVTGQVIAVDGGITLGQSRIGEG